MGSEMCIRDRHEIKHDQLSNVNIAVTNIVTLAVFNLFNSKDVSPEFDVN